MNQISHSPTHPLTPAGKWVSGRVSKWAWCLVLGACLSGCATSEKLVDSKITFVPATGAMLWSLPKDASWSWMAYGQDMVLANGSTNHISLVISNGVFRNNPMVMDAATRHDVQVINATGQQIQAAIGGAAAAAAKGAGVP